MWRAFAFAVFFVGLVTTTNGQRNRPRASNGCANGYATIDKCTNQLTLFGDDNFVFPENTTSMNTHGLQIVRYEKCIKEYAQRCLPTYPKQVTSVLVYGIAKTNKGYCSGPNKKRSFKKRSLVKERGKNCLNGFIDALQGISVKAAKKLKIPMACCKYYQLKQCILREIAKEGPPKCREEQEVEFERVIDGYAQEVLRLICGDYIEESDKCESLLPKVPKKDKNMKRTQSLLPPFIDILKSI